jgi:23S rRNA-/tRNA-specific pseudouridylate synthase
MNPYYKTVFENEHFIIVDKAPMVLSVYPRMEDGRVVLGKVLEDDLGIKIYPVHRLDYEVQGLVMYAKTAEAHKVANGWFENKQVEKTYRALSTKLSSDVLRPFEFELNTEYLWKSMLLKGKKRAYESPHGKSSLTKVKLLKNENGRFSFDLNPVTGRSHQLRFELFSHGYPILGDELYSSTESFPVGIALRAYRINFLNAPSREKFSLPDQIEISENFI